MSNLYQYEISDLKEQLEKWEQLLDGRLEGHTLYVNNGNCRGQVEGYMLEEVELIVIQMDVFKSFIMERSGMRTTGWLPILVYQNSEVEVLTEEGEIFDLGLNEGIFFTNMPSGIHLKAGKDILVVVIRFKKALLEKWLGSASLYLGFDVDKSFLYFEPLVPQFRDTLNQIRKPEVEKELKEYFFNIKCHEMIMQSVDALLKRDSLGQQSQAQDMIPIFNARNLLTQDLSKPLTIQQLSEKCGMSSTRLRILFKQVFGKTVHQYLDDYRFNEAKKRFEQGANNVTEVAYSIGYAHLGHFTAKFKKYFGLTPKQYAKYVNKNK